MPRKKKEAPVVEAPIRFNQKVLEELIPGPMSAAGLEGLFRQMKKAVLERALNAEPTHPLGYPKGDAPAEKGANHRNGSTPKTVLTDEGPLALEIPRDRQGSFEPQIIGKHERRFTGFDDKVVSMYSRVMSVREIQGHLLEMYAVDVSPQFISDVTDAVMTEVTEWQARPLEPLYAVVFFDCLRVKIRDEGTVRNKAVYLALGVLPDGSRDVLGLWIEQSEGAKFWLKVFNELKNRGVEEVLIAVVDGLKGFPEAIEAAFPLTTVQTCIVHLIRNSLDYVSWKDRKSVAAALKPIYTAPTQAAAQAALAAFEAERVTPAALLTPSSDRVAIPSISQGLAARNPQLTRAARRSDTLRGAIGFPIVYPATARLPLPTAGQVAILGRAGAPCEPGYTTRPLRGSPSVGIVRS